LPTFASNIILFVIYVATSTAGLLMLKGAMSRIRTAGNEIFSLTPDTLWLAGGFGLYVVSFLVWLRILNRLPLSTAYPIAIGLTLAVSTSGATLLLGERLGTLKIAGILLIFLGCVALTMERTRP
jgi:multidrug transporter EmrE-like cation transporter